MSAPEPIPSTEIELRRRAAAADWRERLVEAGLCELMDRAKLPGPATKAAEPQPVVVKVEFPPEVTMRAVPTETVAERGNDGLITRSVTRPIRE
jgi:hypothetical protein